MLYRISIYITVFVLSLVNISTLEAVPARPQPVKVMQPDGTNVTVIIKGDEWFNWTTTEDGYRIVRNAEGVFEYAEFLKSGIVVSTGVKANDLKERDSHELNFLRDKVKNVGVTKKVILQAREKKIKPKQESLLKSASQVQEGFPKSGKRNYLLILANYSNTTTTYSQSDFDSFMKQEDYNGTGSFRDYFIENSNPANPLDITTTVTAWVNLPRTREFYAPESQWAQCAMDAILEAEAQGVDFSKYDNNNDGVVDGIAIIHQGAGREVTGDSNDIWSHSNRLVDFSTSKRTFDGVIVEEYTLQPELYDAIENRINTIGVICHEFGHTLGAPDFYDADVEENGEYLGTGDWDCMSNGSYNGDYVGGNYIYGIYPAHYNPFLKVYFGWMDVSNISTAQQITLEPTINTRTITKVETSTEGEYYLLENKQQLGFDVGLSGEGLLIYHVDENHINLNWNSNRVNIGEHQGMYPVPAEGLINSATCLFPTAKVKEFTDGSNPASKDWAGNSVNKSITEIIVDGDNVEFDFMALQNGAPQALLLDVKEYDKINVSWTPSEDEYPVLVAWSNDGNFGEPDPSTNYEKDDVIAGGGVVMHYGGDLNNVIHNDLSETTTYYYRIWSNTGSEFSSFLGRSATTFVKPIDLYPWFDGFEAGLNNWEEEVVVGEKIDWMTFDGGDNQPANAYDGSLNALFYGEEYGKSTRLISPKFTVTEDRWYHFSFYHAQVPWDGDQDSLKVLYRIGEIGEWIDLATYKQSVTNWTLREFDLNPGADFYIAFQGYTNYGYGVAVDNVTLAEQQGTGYSVSYAITNNEGAITDASVTFNGETLMTDLNGNVIFMDVLPGAEIPYSVYKEGYIDYTGTVSVVDQDVNQGVELTVTTILEQLGEVEFEVFPNPTDGILNINLRRGGATYDLCSLAGHHIQKGTFESRESILDLSGLNSGMYILKVYQDNDIYRTKIFVK